MVHHFRRAKFEWVSNFPPGHWALGLQKLPLVRFKDCACLCRTNDTGLSPTVGTHIVRPPSLPPSRGRVSRPKVVKDEGAPLDMPLGGSPKGLPYPSPKKFMGTLEGAASRTRRPAHGRATARVAPTGIWKCLRIRRLSELNLSPTNPKGALLKCIPN